MQCNFPEVSRMIRDHTVLETKLVLSNKVYSLPYYRASLACHGKTRGTLTKKHCQPFQFSHYISLIHSEDTDLFSFVLVFYSYHIAQLKI